MNWKVLFPVLFVGFVAVSGERKVVSLVELAKCKQYQCYGYGYKAFYLAQDIHHMRNETDLLHIRIAILAGRDAHILLSDTDSPTITDNVVEIVLGAGSNTFAEIRRRMGFSSIKSRRVLDILSFVDPMAFEIRVTQSGVIDVRYEGDEEPLISAEYGRPNVSVQFIGFSCWGTSTCKFFFDCPSSLYDELIETNNTQSPTETLENDLFSGLTTSIAPYKLSQIAMSLDIYNVQFDHMKNMIRTRAKLYYQWEDTKLQWDPENYDNIRKIDMQYHSYQTWAPILNIANVLEAKHTDTSEVALKATVYNNGTVNGFTKHFEIETWCSVKESKEWPHDEVKCDLIFSVANAFDVSLTRLDRQQKIQQSENSAWKVLSVDMTLFTANGQIRYSMNLKRNDSFIDSLFWSPLIFILVTLMVSIFVQESFYRLFLLMVCSMMTVVSLVTLSQLIPPQSCPLVVQYYCGSVIFIILGVICHIYAQRMQHDPPAENPPFWISGMSRSRIWNYLLCFVPDSSDYDNLHKTTASWMNLSTAIDRVYLLSVLFFIIFISIIGM